MKLRPVYTARFSYPKVRIVKLTGKNGTEEERYYVAEGTCEGEVSGRLEGINHPHRRTDETMLLNMQGFVETDDHAVLTVDYQGFGRTMERSQALYRTMGLGEERVKNKMQVVGFARHATESEKYRWLNDTVCAVAGAVTIPAGVAAGQVKPTDLKLVFSVAEMLWEPPE
jgi:hypothetical protein